MKKIIAMALSFMLTFSLTACDNRNDDNVTSYKAGTYESSADGMNGAVKVSVVFDETSIKEITVLEHKETEGLSDPAINDIPADIIKYQSLGVDTITGATMTSKAILSAVSQCVEEAGGDAEALKKVEINTEVSNELIKTNSDVVVIGGGSAGLSAAVAAAQNGCSVKLIETNSYLGGNTVRTGGAMIATDPESMPKENMTEAQYNEIERLLNIEMESPIAQEWQNKVREDIKPYISGEKTGMYDSVELTALQYHANNYQRTNPEHLYDMFDESLDVKHWLADMGVNWTDTPSVLVGHGWPRTYYSTEHKGGTAYVDVFVEYIKEKNLDVEIITQVRGKELITEGDKVVGVKAVSSKGQPYELKADKGVIIATGGFGANPELLEKYSDGYFPNVGELLSDNDPACVGDGVIMGEQVNAGFYDMGHLQVLPITDPEDGSTKTFAGATTGLYVNKEGKRFVNETADRDTMSTAILNQTDQQYYVISSESNNGIDSEGKNMMGIELERLLEAGKVIKADTLEELAEKINIESSVLIETVEKFNEACRTGNDPEFGRVTFQPDVINAGASLEVTEGPFYACLRAPAVHITKGGILIDADSRVLNENEEPIKGLYAAGEVTGGINVKGIGQSLHTGRRAGIAISKEK